MHTICVSFYCSAVGITGMVEVAKSISVPAGVEDVIFVVDEVVGLLVFERICFFQDGLSMVMEAVGHKVSSVMT